MLLWAALMGGIAATYTPDRAFFVEQLHVHRRCDTFAMFKLYMSRYLWWDYVVDDPARKIWDEVMPTSQLEKYVFDLVTMIKFLTVLTMIPGTNKCSERMISMMAALTSHGADRRSVGI